jgi:hypothetical protein
MMRMKRQANLQNYVAVDIGIAVDSHRNEVVGVQREEELSLWIAVDDGDGDEVAAVGPWVLQLLPLSRDFGEENVDFPCCPFVASLYNHLLILCWIGQECKTRREKEEMVTRTLHTYTYLYCLDAVVDVDDTVASQHWTHYIASCCR